MLPGGEAEEARREYGEIKIGNQALAFSPPDNNLDFLRAKSVQSPARKAWMFVSVMLFYSWIAQRVALCQFVNHDRSEQTCRVLDDVPCARAAGIRRTGHIPGWRVKGAS